MSTAPTTYVIRHEAKGCRLVRVGEFITHTDGDRDTFQPACHACGWKGQSYPNRQVEYRRLAERDAQQHRCHA